MKKLLILSATLLYSIITFSQAPTIQWQKPLGGTSSDDAQCIEQTADGGYIVAGYSESNDGDVSGNHGGYDCWIVKLDTAGTIQWKKSLGGSKEDAALSIKQTLDGGYIMAGGSYSNDGDVTANHGFADYWIVKLDSLGIIQWQKSLGGTDQDYAYSIQQTNDGGYIVAGFTESNNGDVTVNHGLSDYWIVKLDAFGTLQWEKTLGGTDFDYAYFIQQTLDGGYIIAGRSNSNDGDVAGNHGTTCIQADYWIVKLSALGTIQWQKCLGGTGDDKATSIRQTLDGGYIIGGDSWSNDGDVTWNYGYSDCWIVKLDAVGTIQWQKSFGGTGNDHTKSIQRSEERRVGEECIVQWSQ